jgi:hypothetical protein
VSCLSCVSAHQRGRFWFCNRCGRQLSLRPVPALAVAHAQGTPSRPGTEVPDAVVLDFEAARRVRLARTI